MTGSQTPETDAARHDLSDYGPPVPCSWGDWVAADYARKLERERDEAREDRKNSRQSLAFALEQLDEARELLRILAGLVAYGLGQSGEEWSLEAMRQATTAIKNAKSLEETK